MEKTLQIIRKNLLSIICGVVALLAMIALAYPLAGMYKRFQAELTTRAAAYSRAQTLLNTDRFLPIVRAGAPADPLTTFPTDQAIQDAEAARDRVHEQSDELLQKAVEVSRAGHDLLLAPDILPEPGDRAFQYQTAYLDMVQKQLPQQMMGVMPPNAEEVKAATEALHQTEVENRIIKVNGVEENRQQLERDFQDLAAKLPDQLLQERATKFKLYMDPTSLSVHPTMLDPKRPTPAEIWYAQLSLWVEQDVAASIIQANNNVPGSDILTDPVKRLVRLEVPEGPAIYFLASGTPAPGAPAAADASATADPREYLRSPTGHVCNSVYDVIQFHLVMDVDQRQIPLILHALQDGKLTNVLSVDLAEVDTGAAVDEGYVYGSAPVVRMSLNCETLFLRAWTVKLMPDEVKYNDLHIPPPAAPGA